MHGMRLDCQEQISNPTQKANRSMTIMCIYIM